MKIRPSVVLFFGAMTLAATSNAFAWGHAGGGGFGGGRFVSQNRPFVDHRFADRRFFFVHRGFFVGPPVVPPPALIFGPPIIGAPPMVIAPVTPIAPFP